VKELIIHSKKHGTHTVFYDDEDHDIVTQYTWTLNFKSDNQQYAYTTYKDGLLKKTD